MSGDNWMTSVRKRRFGNLSTQAAKARLRLETLEVRITPVVGQLGDATKALPGGIYDGVVKVGFGDFAGTGSLISPGYGHFILTSGHSTGIKHDNTIEFHLARTGVTVPPIKFDVPSIEVETPVDKGYDPKEIVSGLDLAVVPLYAADKNTAYSNYYIAPFKAQSRDLSESTAEVSKAITFVGFGATGNGAAGAGGADMSKRFGTNKIDATGAINKNAIFGIKNAVGNGQIAFEYKNEKSELIDANKGKLTADTIKTALESIKIDGAFPLKNNIDVLAIDSDAGNFAIKFKMDLAGKKLASEDLFMLVPAAFKDAVSGFIISGSADDDTLLMDFDNGRPENDYFGQLFNIKDAPATDSGAAEGDSGGPVLLGDGKIAGVIHGGYTNAANPADSTSKRDSSFGEAFKITRVSSHVTWIKSASAGKVTGANKYGVTLDMNKQVVGITKPGEDITIKIVKNGADLVITLAGSTDYDGEYYRAPLANIKQIRIISSDSDKQTVEISDADLLKIVNINGAQAKAKQTIEIKKQSALPTTPKEPITFVGGSGKDELVVHDDDGQDTFYAISSTQLTADAGTQYNFSAIEDFSLIGAQTSLSHFSGRIVPVAGASFLAW